MRFMKKIYNIYKRWIKRVTLFCLT